MAFVLSVKKTKLNNRKASRAVACLLAFAQSGGVESSRLPLEVHRIQAVGGNMFPPKILISIRRWENFFRSLLYVNNEAADTAGASACVPQCDPTVNFVSRYPTFSQVANVSA